jgi:hypothetical protein
MKRGLFGDKLGKEDNIKMDEKDIVFVEYEVE